MKPAEGEAQQNAAEQILLEDSAVGSTAVHRRVCKGTAEQIRVQLKSENSFLGSFLEGNTPNKQLRRVKSKGHGDGTFWAFLREEQKIRKEEGKAKEKAAEKNQNKVDF